MSQDQNLLGLSDKVKKEYQAAYYDILRKRLRKSTGAVKMPLGRMRNVYKHIDSSKELDLIDKGRDYLLSIGDRYQNCINAIDDGNVKSVDIDFGPYANRSYPVGSVEANIKNMYNIWWDKYKKKLPLLSDLPAVGESAAVASVGEVLMAYVAALSQEGRTLYPLYLADKIEEQHKPYYFKVLSEILKDSSVSFKLQNDMIHTFYKYFNTKAQLHVVDKMRDEISTSMSMCDDCRRIIEKKYGVE